MELGNTKMIQLPPMTRAQVRVLLAHLELGGQILEKLKEDAHDESCTYIAVRSMVEDALYESGERSTGFEAFGVPEKPRLEMVRRGVDR